MIPYDPLLDGGAALRARAKLRTRRCLATVGACLLGTPLAIHAQQDGGKVAVADEAACSRGVISSIEVDSRSIYDPESTSIAPLAWTYQALNFLHVNTSESFIRGELLFEEGDCFDPFLLSESDRLLDQYGFIYVEDITHEDDGAGGRSVRVATRDEWSTKVDVGVTYDDGLNLEKLQVTEENFLGRGVFAEFTHYARRETRTRSFGVRTPRFFGRSDAGIAAGTSRAGPFFEQYWRYPFVGEAGRVALREGYERGTDFFAYSTDGAEPYIQVLVPARRELAELSGAYRFGRPGASVILGASLTRDVVTFRDVPEITFGDFDEREPLPGTPPSRLERQLRPFSATRMALHLGTRRYRYVEYTGLDDLRHTENVGLGYFAGVTLGRSVGLLTSDEAPAEDDVFARSHVSLTVPVGLGLFVWGATVEARHESNGWRDLLAEADLAAYGRTERLPGHTLFFRASSAGGWDTTLPYQLSLGGREGIRSLPEDRFPGGRMLRFVLEDRVALPWPTETADLGLTFFSDLGRVWPGDVPYGVDSGWQAAVGFGLRIGLPRGTRHIWRTDIAFPVGPSGGSPIFRVTFEVNKLRSGFFTPDVLRSRRFQLGPETF